jgi:hypothetical protein
VLVELIGDNGLRALIHVYVLDGLLSRLVKPCQGFQRGTAIRLRLQC